MHPLLIHKDFWPLVKSYLKSEEDTTKGAATIPSSLFCLSAPKYLSHRIITGISSRKVQIASYAEQEQHDVSAERDR